MWSRYIVRGGTMLASIAVLGASFETFAVRNLNAQTVVDTGSAQVGRGGGRGGGDNNRTGFQGPSRAKLEEFHKFYERMLRERVAFTDEQIVKWRAWNTRFDMERRSTWAEERELRNTLRQQLARGVTPDEAKVVDAMDRWVKLDRKRLDQKERENKALATFLSPVQRARFFAIQDETQRGFQETEGRRDGMNRAGGRGGPPLQMRGDSAAIAKFRQGMRGDSAGGRFPGRGTRPPGKVDTLPLARPVKN